MTSCELDYHLSNSSESMEYEETDSDDENKLQIVETMSGMAGGSSSMATLTPRTLMRSLSAVETLKEDYQMGGGMTSDAVESLLLLGQAPTVTTSGDETEMRVNGNQRVRGYKYSNSAEQRMMVNYYQRMRERNNEASKRCRLKRRIKQDSLEKTRLLLANQKDILKNRVAKLHKIKEILKSACHATGNDASSAECLRYCNLIKCCQKDMPDCADLSNLQLIKKSRFIRETNLEEIIGAQAPDLNDLRPLKRGPRKVDTDTNFTIDPESLILKPESPSLSSSAPMDLSAGSKMTTQHNPKPVNLVKTRSLPSPAKPDNGGVVKPKAGPVTYVTLAPKSAAVPIPGRTVIVDNPNNSLPKNVIPFLNGPNSPVHKQPGTISQLNINGTTIFVTPIGSPIINLPLNPLPTSKPSQSPPKPFQMSPRPPPMEVLINKVEPEVVIKSEPDIEEAKEEIVAEDEEFVPENPLVIKTEEEDIAMEVAEAPAPVTKVEEEQDPTVCCAAVLAKKEDISTCSMDLIDLNSLNQTLDLVTLEPRTAGELTSAEKYIIKSRLEMAFWRAEETASVICSAHRAKIVNDTNTQGCSVCGKKRSKKLDMFIITYRMSVEFYMTNGQFLSIGQLACSSCKAKSLKSLDFSNSFILPDAGHPLNNPKPAFLCDSQSQSVISPKKETEDHPSVPTVDATKAKPLLIPQDIILSREVVLSPSGLNQGKCIPQQTHPRLSPVHITSTTDTIPSNSTHSPRSDQAKAKQNLKEALMALNPNYKPLGFTIDSLASCSEGVLNDALKATQEAMTTILSTIAPGQESSLWKLICPEMETFFNKQDTQQPHTQISGEDTKSK